MDSTETRPAVVVNGVRYNWPARPVVVVCIDGGDPAYLRQGLQDGVIPTIAQFMTQGFGAVAEGSMPSFTCPNNISIITGTPTSRHGISGNYYLDTATGEAVVMTGPELMRADTILAGFAGAGASVVSIIQPAGPGYQSVLITKKGSAFTSIPALKGAVLALVDPASTSGSLIPEAVFPKEQHLPPLNQYFSRVIFSGGHDLSTLAVADGKVDAAFVATHRFMEAVNAGKVSGAGKSTLIRCVNRLVEPSHGRVLFGGRDMLRLNGRDLRQERRNIGMIFQQFNLIERLSVMDNVLTGRLGYTGTLRSLFRLFARDDIERAIQLLDRVGLAEHMDKRADQLSGGQRQRVGIARALIQNPKLLLVDEPTSSLDPKISREVMALIREVARECDIPVLCNIHDVALALEFGTRVIGLRGGRVLFDAPAGEVNRSILEQIYGMESL